MKFAAFCTKGLENICEMELRQFDTQVMIIEKRTKLIVFEYTDNPENLKNLRTIDDICIFVENFDFESAIESIKRIRNIKNYFSITTNDESKKQVMIDLLQRYEYIEKQRDNLDIRIFVDGDFILYGIRLFNKPLGDRSYKVKELPGSLKPTIAAALLYPLWNSSINSKIVDNFCGSGTILCEAKNFSSELYGGDVNPISVSSTQSNLKKLGYSYLERIKIQDGTKTKWQSNYFDFAISNLPWDKQIKTDHIHDLYERSIQEYSRILKPNGTLVILAVKSEIVIKMMKKYFPKLKITTIEIGFLGQNPKITIAS